jgi:acetyl-CoA synthetase
MSIVYKPTAPWIRDSHLSRWLDRLHLSLDQLQAKAENEPEWFWEEVLSELQLDFDRDYEKLLTQSFPFPSWAQGGKLSIVHNCIDRHLKTQGNKICLRFEGDSPGQSKNWSFEDLARESSYIAKQLQEAGAQPGDRAALLMPMSLEMVASFFGILRAGLSVIPIFSGYGAEAIAARLQQSQTKFVFVQEKTFRRGKEIPVLEGLKSLQKDCPSLKHIFVLKRDEFHRGHLEQKIIPPHSFEAEAECLLLYTSGTSGEPKACVHTSFGVLAITGKEHRFSFDVKATDSFFWYTDIGWMMGPWELIGALQFSCAVVLYEGVPDYPDATRLWQILDDHKVTHFGISPTAIRVLKKQDQTDLEKRDLSSLRVLGSTGEAWDEESWMWFFEKVGKSRCPIINISGGTEIMGCLLSPTPLDALKPSSLVRPALGVATQSWSEEREVLKEGIGHLVCVQPIPSMTKGFLGSTERYLETYFSKFGDQVWYHGDWAQIDSEGFWFLKGRSDDTIKVAGKRVGPNEYESVLMGDPAVAEVAAVGLPHEIKGESVSCFVVLKNPKEATDETSLRLHQKIVDRMGKALSAEFIYFVSALPKTRSGKILRSLIRKLKLGEEVSMEAAENPDSFQAIREAK